MKELATAFIIKLESEEIKYETREFDDGRDVINFGFAGNNCPHIRIVCVFPKDGRSVQERCYSICKVPDDKRGVMLESINLLNAESRWIKYYIDSDKEVTCETDILVNIDTAAGSCFEMCIGIMKIVDDAYPKFMKTLWS